MPWNFSIPGHLKTPPICERLRPMGRPKRSNELRKLMAYVLGRRPDEFGLVPDQEGFVRIKDLIKAISEEPDWGYVRNSHIHEVLITSPERPFIVKEDRIKAAGCDAAIRPVTGSVPPKLLYHCVRRRAYPVVCEKGITPMGQHRVFLATTQEMALRVGKRRDSEPVLLTVQARRAHEAGISSVRQGELIYMVDHVPVGYFTGPPLPKEKRDGPSAKKEKAPAQEPLAGAFVLDMERSKELHQQRLKRKGLKKEIAWKKEARRFRRKHKE
jgi:putative RNA 2'-phosphotransferase